MEIVFILILIISIILHEIAHGWVAYILGDPTAKLAGRLTLNPVKHVDFLGSIIIPFILVITGSSILFGWAKPVPYNPYNLSSRQQEALVAGAGSFVNVLLALIFGLSTRFFDLPSGIEELFLLIVIINLFLAVINMLPIPPLDGSKVLKALLPFKMSAALDQMFRGLESKLGVLGMIFLAIIILILLLEPLVSFIYYLSHLITG